MKTLCFTLLACALVAQAKNNKVPPTPPIPPGPHVYSVLASDWALSSTNHPWPLAQIPTGGLSFVFPDHADINNASFGPEFVGYLNTASGALTGASFITMTLRVVATSGTPVFMYDSQKINTCPRPAHARPYFEIANDASNFGRWWSNPVAFELAPGTITVTVPLTPDKWSDVNGLFGNSSARVTQGFVGALQKANLIGMTFGGGCFFGHGVDVKDGAARFEVLSFSTF